MCVRVRVCSGATFLLLSGAEVFSAFVGDSEVIAHQCFHLSVTTHQHQRLNSQAHPPLPTAFRHFVFSLGYHPRCLRPCARSHALNSVHGRGRTLPTCDVIILCLTALLLSHSDSEAWRHNMLPRQGRGFVIHPGEFKCAIVTFAMVTTVDR